ncbi:hypothetical protein [Brasilonema sp. UFV-L1]|uniref:hypothetical protein n=1 Tax=Brasilonema sp. UFV-L1 TaxID=2234130 RepID=UPI00145FC74C|nr:hypothetical protein [Brasilonema sp. UFV-L1]NMG09489.1 hypothetical protein [Brasilonema sp. UFV-L1]
MKAYEFPAKITTEGKIELPDTVLQQLPHNQQVKVIILVNEPSEDEEDEEAWRRLASEQLLKGYGEKAQEHIEELLIEGLESGEAIEVTDEWWEQKRTHLMNKLRQEQ